MDAFKRQHLDDFDERYGIEFPTVRPLSTDQCESVRWLLKRRLRLPDEAGLLDLVRAVDERQVALSGNRADEEGFELIASCRTEESLSFHQLVSLRRH